MSAFAIWILSLFMVLPVYKDDVGSPSKHDQLARNSAYIEMAVNRVKWPGDKREFARFLVTWADGETHLSERIGVGECRKYECDPYKSCHGQCLVYRAAGYWQLHITKQLNPDRWQDIFEGNEELSALEAARSAARMRWMCRKHEARFDWVRMTFSALAGDGCFGSFPDLNRRVATYRRLESK